jgi:hypothetical protein
MRGKADQHDTGGIQVGRKLQPAEVFVFGQQDPTLSVGKIH